MLIRQACYYSSYSHSYSLLLIRHAFNLVRKVQTIKSKVQIITATFRLKLGDGHYLGNWQLQHGTRSATDIIIHAPATTFTSKNPAHPTQIQHGHSEHRPGPTRPMPSTIRQDSLGHGP